MQVDPTAGQRCPLDTYLEWDVATWAQALPFWQRHLARALDGARVLEIGARHGGLSLWLAHQGAVVVASDLGGPSDTARSLHDRHPSPTAIEYLDLDATRLDVENEFDVVVFKSVLGGIGGAGGADAQRATLANLHRALKPGGQLLFAENLVASAPVAYLRRRFVQWGARWQYVTLPDLRAMLSPFESATLSTAGTIGLLGRSERQRAALGAIDRRVLDHIGGDRWRYVVFGVATKGR